MSNQHVIPYLTVKNLDQAVDFYQKAFGFEQVGDYCKDEEGLDIHAEMQFQGSKIFLRPECEGTASKAPVTLNVEAPVWLVLYCDDVDSLFAQAVAAGATVFHEPVDADWGERWCKIADPNGHSWSFHKKLK